MGPALNLAFDPVAGMLGTYAIGLGLRGLVGNLIGGQFHYKYKLVQI